MRRRAFIAGGARAVAGLTALAGCADPSPNPSATTTPVPVSDDQMAATIAKLRAQYNAQFDPDYVEHAVLPWYLNTLSDGARPVLPMTDVALTKENALPYDVWGLLSETWKPAPEEGVTVFLQGLEKRGPDNRRKRIYMSAVHPTSTKACTSRRSLTSSTGFNHCHVILFGLHGVSWRCGVDRGAGR